MSREAAAGDPGTPRVELWVRDLAPYGATDRLNAVYETLSRLETEGQIRLDLGVWGRTATLGGDAPDAVTAAVRGKLAEFEAWADRRGHSLAPGFTVRERREAMTGTERHQTVVHLPVVCLAVYADGLDAVYPCTADDRVHTVADCVAALENGRRWGAGDTELAAP